MKIRITLLLLVFLFLTTLPTLAQEPIYLPLIVKEEDMVADPILRVTDGTKTIDLLGFDSGWELSDPYWRPQIARYKSDGNYVDSAMADDTRLVFKKYAPVTESIPLTVKGYNQAQAVRTIRELLQLGRQASDYWTECYEFDDVWLEIRPACNDCR